MENFTQDLAVGKRGEALVKQALAARKHCVEDLSNIAEYQRKDIDMRLTKNGVSVTVEVKNDLRSNTTNNVFVETYNSNNISRNGAGWLNYCEADYLCFVQEEKHLAHIVNRCELIRQIWGGAYRLSNSPFSQGYIVPIG